MEIDGNQKNTIDPAVCECVILHYNNIMPIIIL